MASRHASLPPCVPIPVRRMLMSIADTNRDLAQPPAIGACDGPSNIFHTFHFAPELLVYEEVGKGANGKNSLSRNQKRVASADEHGACEVCTARTRIRQAGEARRRLKHVCQPKSSISAALW